jgi:long-chain acyl-CoA synthetase
MVRYPNHMAAEPSGRTVARLARQVELGAATVELTLSQYRVLGILGTGREASSVLAEKLAVSRPSVTGVVDGLVARGLVERRGDDADRRRIGVDLTPEGRSLLTRADAEVERRLQEIAVHGARGPEAAFAGLAPWQEALDEFRNARHSRSAVLR